MRRLLEILFAILLLILLFPFFLMAVIVVQIDSPGPIIFRQVRIGKGGRKFTLYKLRTMKKGANGSFPPHTQVNDPRFSPVCRFIRATCIDEVPQLWNILKGDMSFVGPRPELPKIVKTYDEEQKNVLKFEPGLFGISQLVLREGVDYRKKLIIENAYYPHRTLLKDFTITFLTPFVIVDNALGKILGHNGKKTAYTNTSWFRFIIRHNGDKSISEVIKKVVNEENADSTFSDTNAMRNSG